MSAPVATETPATPVPAAETAQAVQEEGFRVYIGNLPYSATEEQVREHVAKTGGEILSVILPKKFHSARPAGHAFVMYKDEADAKRAVEQLNETDFGGRKVSLELARSKAENAARKAELIAKRDAERAATKADTAGETTAVESDAKPKKRTGKKSGARRRLPEEGDETAVDAEDAPAKVESGEAKPAKSRKPREARIDEAAPEGEAAKPKAPKARKPRLELTEEISKNTIFVANLPFDVDDAGLAAIFTDLSIEVKSAKVIHGLRRLPNRRPFRGSKGFGFVELVDEAQQHEAVDKVNGAAVGDRKVTAKIAQQMKPVEAEQVEHAAESEAVQPGAGEPAAV